VGLLMKFDSRCLRRCAGQGTQIYFNRNRVISI